MTSTTSDRTDDSREIWSSRFAFIMVSIGAAIGFGNVWRFPSLAYDYGGGAFFIPYLVALFAIGIPMTILELTMGQLYRTGDIGSFGGINKRFSGIGVGSLFCATAIIAYYVPLLVWVLNMFFDSFTDFDKKFKGSGSETYDYFVLDIVGSNTIDSTTNPSLYPTRLVGANVGYLVLSYGLIFSCVGFGVKVTGKVSYFTMGFPIFLLFLFLGYLNSLEGSEDGVKAYIGEWDLSVLEDRPDVWSTAVTQIFFSIGVTFGIMTAYGSHCNKNAPAAENSIIIALLNSSFSFIAGFMIYSGLGNLAFRENESIAGVSTAGPGLLFGTIPNVLAVEGGEGWTRLFFVFLFLLGIDSAFGLFEAVFIVICDTPLGRKYSTQKVAFAQCSVFFLLSLPFVTDAGFYFLDVVDYYVNFIMILVGFFEVVATGWFWGMDKQVEKYGWKPIAACMVGAFGSVILGCIFWFGVESGDNTANGFIAFFAVHIIAALVVAILLKPMVEEGSTLLATIYDLNMGNVLEFKDFLENGTGVKLWWIWAAFIKHVLPPALLVCFANLAQSETASGDSMFGYYGGYVNWPYQGVGIIIVCLTGLFISLSMLFPGVYDNLVTDETLKSIKETNETKDPVEECMDKPNLAEAEA